MTRLRAINAALAATALTAAVALPAAASTGTGNGGASATPPASSSNDSYSAMAATASYKRVEATWYGPGLYGNRLACGGRLTHHTLGVAHRNLPCGTKVAIKYHGRTVVVPVVDRGPYSRGISYDLTQATAQKLGMKATSRVAAAPLGR